MDTERTGPVVELISNLFRKTKDQGIITDIFKATKSFMERDGDDYDYLSKMRKLRERYDTEDGQADYIGASVKKNNGNSQCSGSDSEELEEIMSQGIEVKEKCVEKTELIQKEVDFANTKTEINEKKEKMDLLTIDAADAVDGVSKEGDDEIEDVAAPKSDLKRKAADEEANDAGNTKRKANDEMIPDKNERKRSHICTMNCDDYCKLGTSE